MTEQTDTVLTVAPAEEPFRPSAFKPLNGEDWRDYCQKNPQGFFTDLGKYLIEPQNGFQKEAAERVLAEMHFQRVRDGFHDQLLALEDAAAYFSQESYEALQAKKALQLSTSFTEARSKYFKPQIVQVTGMTKPEIETTETLEMKNWPNEDKKEGKRIITAVTENFPEKDSAALLGLVVQEFNRYERRESFNLMTFEYEVRAYENDLFFNKLVKPEEHQAFLKSLDASHLEVKKPEIS